MIQDADLRDSSFLLEPPRRDGTLIQKNFKIIKNFHGVLGKSSLRAGKSRWL